MGDEQKLTREGRNTESKNDICKSPEAVAPGTSQGLCDLAELEDMGRDG